MDAEGQTFGGTIACGKSCGGTNAKFLEGQIDASCFAWRKVKLLEEVQRLIELKDGLEV